MQRTLILGSALANLSTQAGRIRQLHFSLRVLSQVAASTATTPPPAKSSEEQTPAEKEIERKWAPHSVRTGVIARKRGMTAMWDDFGTKYPVTVLQMENCQVTANVQTVRKDNTTYHAVQIASTNANPSQTTWAMKGHFKKAGVQPKRLVKEFPVTEDAHVPVGTTLSSLHFVPGQYVDVIANSIGKGFQGVMKRWNFSGQGASHGVSVSHRSPGSTGQHQDPGRVFPGKKMAGRLGGERTTVQNLEVVRIDTALDLIFVRGAVPGVDDAFVMVRDAKKRAAIGKHRWERGIGMEVEGKILPKGVADLPFPAGTKEMAQVEGMPQIVQAKTKRVNDPFSAL